MVVESDESDGTFVKLPADIVIVTNIDPEHLDHYGSFDAAKEAFLAFVENIPFYGFAVMCIDHPEVQALIGRVRDRRVITYGRSPQADVRLTDVSYEADGKRSPSDHRPAERRDADIDDLACRCRASTTRSTPPRRWRWRPSSPFATMTSPGLAGFTGVKRRFTRPAWPAASPSSTTTAIIRWKSPRCSKPAAG